METTYNFFYVFASVIVAIFASYVALDLASAIPQSWGRARALWLSGGALAMGTGIWSMHFVGMLAFHMPGMPMAYDIPLMILSVLIAIGASALALFIVSQKHVSLPALISGGIAMAIAIAGMHYVGMFSMRMPATIVWDPVLVALSILIALGASFVALNVSLRMRNRGFSRLKFLASVLMGFAIAGMHYTGMMAATFVHDESVEITGPGLLPSWGLGVTVLSTTSLILGLALMGSFWIRRTKNVDDTLRASEDRFRLLVETIRDYAIFALDPDGRIATWNSGAQSILGYTAAEVVGKHFSIFYTPEDLAIHFPDQELELARKNGRFETDGLHVRKNGTRFWANVVIVPIYDHEGNLTGFSKVTRDITEKKEHEAYLQKMNDELEKRVEDRTRKLSESEAQLSSITNALPVLVAQLDRSERFLFANDFFCTWFQLPRDRVIGATFRQVLGAERYPHNQPFVEQALQGKTVSYERASMSGSYHAVLSVTFVPQFDENGAPNGFTLVATDISRHKEIEAELKRAKEMADAANETKSAFLANMSHEIRTPLGIILGFSELLLNHEMSPSERANSVEVIKRNGRLLSGVINDILDLSKVEAGKLEVEKIDVSFEEILNEVESLLKFEATEKGLQFSVFREARLPAKVTTDPLRLRQILVNIIGNAIKFTEKGSIEIKIGLIRNAPKPPKLAFTVKDTGRGIAPEYAGRLFTPFTQGDVSMTRKFGGTGLGLVLSKKLANSLGGDVVLTETAPNKGSTFVITIDPGLTEDAANFGPMLPRETPPPPAVHPPEQNLSHMKILVVEDSHDNQVLIRQLLRPTRAAVEVAVNGKEGVEKALRDNFNLILMDLQMPEMDGYEATRELRKNGYRKPIVALTAHTMKEERRRCLESGFDEHVGKPIQRERLLEIVELYSKPDSSAVTH